MTKDLWFRGMEVKEEGEREEFQADESSLGSDGFENETRGLQVAALDPSNSRIGRGCFRARPSDDQENPRLPSERGDPGRKC